MMIRPFHSRLVLSVMAIALVVVSLTGLSRPAHALQSSFEAINFVPTSDNSNYYTVWGSRTLDPRQLHVDFSFDYGHTPLECDGCPAQQVIDHLVVGNFSFGLGITDRFQLGIGLPVVLYNEFFNDTTGNDQRDGGLGDLHLESKIRIVDVDQHRVGFSILPFITFPTGDAPKFLGAGAVTGGGKLIVDFKPVDAFELALNAGYRARDNVTRTNTRIDDQFVYGLGLVGHATSHLDVIGEVQGSTVVDDFFSTVAQSPVEAEVGLRYRLDNGFAFNIGGGPGLVDGVGTPQFRAIAGVSFTSPSNGAPTERKTSPKRAHLDADKKKIVITDKIYFDFDKDTLKSESFPVLDDVAAVMKEDTRIKLVMVEGHTDSVGSTSYNDALSTRRAKSAMAYLIKAGVDASRLQSSGKGESTPIASNATEDGRSQNRRTEFLVVEFGSR